MTSNYGILRGDTITVDLLNPSAYHELAGIPHSYIGGKRGLLFNNPVSVYILKNSSKLSLGDGRLLQLLVLLSDPAIVKDFRDSYRGESVNLSNATFIVEFDRDGDALIGDPILLDRCTVPTAAKSAKHLAYKPLRRMVHHV